MSGVSSGVTSTRTQKVTNSKAHLFLILRQKVRFFMSLDYDARMQIRFSTDDPQFKQAIDLIKLKYRTTAAAKAVRRSVYDFAKMEVEIEMLRAHNDSMSSEIDRLRDLLEVHRDTKLGTKWRYLR